MDTDRMPIYTGSTAIVPGLKPEKIQEVNLAVAKASRNTTGVFVGVFEQAAEQARKAELEQQLKAGVSLYLGKDQGRPEAQPGDVKA
jgi:hypothetical protein